MDDAYAGYAGAVSIFTEAGYGRWAPVWWLVRRLFRWEVNHTGLIIEVDGVSWVYEATPRGICKWRWKNKKKEDARFFFYLFRRPLDQEALDYLYTLAESSVDTPYAYGTLLDAMCYWLRQAWRKVALREPVYFCSGFVASLCRDIGRPLCTEACVYVSPQMVHTSPALYRFSEFLHGTYRVVERPSDGLECQCSTHIAGAILRLGMQSPACLA